MVFFDGYISTGKRNGKLFLGASTFCWYFNLRKIDVNFAPYKLVVLHGSLPLLPFWAGDPMAPCHALFFGWGKLWHRATR